MAMSKASPPAKVSVLGGIEGTELSGTKEPSLKEWHLLLGELVCVLMGERSSLSGRLGGGPLVGELLRDMFGDGSLGISFVEGMIGGCGGGLLKVFTRDWADCEEETAAAAEEEEACGRGTGLGLTFLARSGFGGVIVSSVCICGLAGRFGLAGIP